MRVWRLPFLACLVGWAAVAHAQEPKRGECKREMRRMLGKQCLKCHGPALQKKGVRLDSHEAALKRKAIVPGDVKASKLLERIVSEDEDERMPPKGAGERLKPAQV